MRMLRLKWVQLGKPWFFGWVVFIFKFCLGFFSVLVLFTCLCVVLLGFFVVLGFFNSFCCCCGVFLCYCCWFFNVLVPFELGVYWLWIWVCRASDTMRCRTQFWVLCPGSPGVGLKPDNTHPFAEEFRLLPGFWPHPKCCWQNQWLSFAFYSQWEENQERKQSLVIQRLCVGQRLCFCSAFKGRLMHTQLGCS